MEDSTWMSVVDLQKEGLSVQDLMSRGSRIFLPGKFDVEALYQAHNENKWMV